MLRNLVAKLKPLGKSQIFWCVLGATICLVWMGTPKPAQHPDYSDAVARYQMTELPGFSIAFAFLAVWVQGRAHNWSRGRLRTPAKEKKNA